LVVDIRGCNVNDVNQVPDDSCATASANGYNELTDTETNVTSDKVVDTCVARNEATAYLKKAL